MKRTSLMRMPRRLAAAGAVAALCLTAAPAAATAAEAKPVGPTQAAAPASGWFRTDPGQMFAQLRDVPSFDTSGGYNKVDGDYVDVHCYIMGETGPDESRIWWRVYDADQQTPNGMGYWGWAHTSELEVSDSFVPPC